MQIIAENKSVKILKRKHTNGNKIVQFQDKIGNSIVDSFYGTLHETQTTSELTEQLEKNVQNDRTIFQSRL